MTGSGRGSRSVKKPASSLADGRRRSQGSSHSTASTPRRDQSVPRPALSTNASSSGSASLARASSQTRAKSTSNIPKLLSRDPEPQVKGPNRHAFRLREAVRDSTGSDPVSQPNPSIITQWTPETFKTHLMAPQNEAMSTASSPGPGQSVPQLSDMVFDGLTVDIPTTKLDMSDLEMAFRKPSFTRAFTEPITTAVAEEHEPVQEHEPADKINQINIGVFGKGKSDFVEKVLDLDVQKPFTSKQKSMTIQGDTYNVRLLKLSFDDLCDLSEQSTDPGSNNHSSDLPRIDGVVALYDVMDKASLLQVPDVIDALQDAALPTVLASPERVDPPAISKAGNSFIEMKAKSVLKDVNVMQTSDNSPETQKQCVSVLIQDIVSSDGARNSERNRPRAKSSAHLAAAPRTTEESRRGRAATDYVRPALKTSASHGDVTSLSLLSMPERVIPHDNFVGPYSADRDTTFLDDGSPSKERPISMALSKLQYNQSHVTDAVALQHAATFDELIDRLRAPVNSKSYLKFVSTFLAFYRNFAAPFTLLNALIGTLSSSTISNREQETTACLTTVEKWINAYPGDFANSLTRTRLENFLLDVKQLLNLAALTERISLSLDTVVENDDTEWANSDISLTRLDTAGTFLSTSSVDNAEDWSGTTTPRDVTHRIDRMTASVDAKLIFGGKSISVLTALGPSKGDIDSVSSSQTLIDVAEPAQRQARLLSPNPSLTLNKIQWRLFMAQPDDEIARELTRMDWIMFSSLRPRDIIRHVTVPANSQYRFRDLENVNRMIGHFNHIAFWVTNLVLLRDKPKHRAQILEKLMRIARKVRELNNYNALGALVAGIQGNSVHRLSQTRALVSPETQKDFMKLEILVSTQKSHFAYRLAWDNTTTARVPFLPLHRRDLFSAEAGNKSFIEIPPPIPSDNLSLATSRTDTSSMTGYTASFLSSSSASSSRRSSATTAAETPTPTPSGPKINWRKFEIMGDILLNIQRAQATSYTGFVANDVVKALVLDCRIDKDEDILYERSIAVEPPAPSSATAMTAAAAAAGTSGADGAAGTGSVRRKLTWLAKYYGLTNREGDAAPGGGAFAVAASGLQRGLVAAE